MAVRLAVALTLALMLPGAAPGADINDKEDAMTASGPPPVTSGGSVPPPPLVLPVEVGGIQISVAEDGLPLDAADTSGWLRATDVATGETLWLKQAFTAPPAEAGDPMANADRTLNTRGLSVDGDSVIVEDALGRRFRIDPASGTSQALE